MRRSYGYAAIAAALAAACALAALIYLKSPHATLRITTGPLGGTADGFLAGIGTVLRKHHPFMSVQPVQVDGLAESSARLEARQVDLAIVRSDASPPRNGQTIVVLRRDAVAFLTPPSARLETLSGLSGRTVALIAGRTQAEDEALLDLLLGFYNVDPKAVRRLVVPIGDLGKTLREKPVAAVLSVGPVGPGGLVDAVAAMARSVGPPRLLAFDDADAIASRFPGLESLDVPKGALRPRPELPDDSVTVMAVTYRLAAPFSMLNFEAGAIARSVLAAKADLAAAFPQAAQIEAPDPDANTSVLPVHPGVAQYLASGEQSLLDDLQGYAYAAAMAFSVIGSSWAMVASRMRRKQDAADRTQIARLIAIADQARRATAPDLLRLQDALHEALAEIIEAGRSDTTVLLAASHAQSMISWRQSLGEPDRAKASTLSALG
jgi:TRAP-type uncharacterized transport system substrate-binding protein